MVDVSGVWKLISTLECQEDVDAHRNLLGRCRSLVDVRFQVLNLIDPVGFSRTLHHSSKTLKNITIYAIRFYAADDPFCGLVDNLEQMPREYVIENLELMHCQDLYIVTALIYLSFSTYFLSILELT
ncbi:hypothetical protein BDN70DRAFT_592296 [Pholiota conissans]|uniref:Uncharacterized protein n=1 Tax=Pholiota conissans TaxID=109636 RepID=A0A9P5ZGP5_9AGAR|nr:hypothetical protein BDN70DRAFT_592296 [Pholiota conissans]